MTNEYVVVNDFGCRAGISTFDSPEKAKAFLSWLVGDRRDEMRRAAEENEASGFAGGNGAWYAWFNKRDGEKDRSYRILYREVSPWRELEETE